MAQAGRARPGIIPLVAMALASFVASCGGEPPALTVGDLAFGERDLLGLDAGRRMRLAEIGALALAVDRGALIERSTALREREIQRSLVAALRTHHLLEAAGVGDDVLTAHYDVNPEHELVVRHLVVLAERGLPRSVRTEARARAQAAVERVRSGEDFAAVAGEVSEEPGAAERGGLLTPGREGTWVEEFWAAADALEPGQVSGIVETQFGFHVLRLEERRVVPFSEARDRSARRVAAMLPEAPFDRLRSTVSDGIVMEDALDSWRDGPADRILATWPEGSLSVDAFRRYVATEPAAEERAADGGGEALGAVVKRAALESALAERARTLGLQPDAAMVDARMDDWRVQAEGWAAVLGLVGVGSLEDLAQRALTALGATGQNATVVREELQRLRGPLLRSLYPIETAGVARP